MARRLDQLPYIARVSLPDDRARADIEISMKGGNAAAQLEQTDRLFSDFVTAVQAGMFAGENVPPGDSAFEVLSRASDAGQLRYRCSIQGIDAGAFRVLLNALAESARTREPLAEVRLIGPANATGTLGVEAIRTHPWPGRVQKTPFKLALKEFYFEDREPVIRMEFQRPPRDDEFEKVEAMLRAWDGIVAIGGYLDASTREDDLMPEPGELYLAEPAVVEHLLYAFQGPKETYNAVINMAVKVHSTICRLRVLEIE